MQHLWGHSEVVFEETETECGVIVVRAHAVGGNGASSVHHHKYHHNVLLVLAGSMLLDFCNTDGEVESTMTLKTGCEMKVDPGENHRLRFPQKAELLEYYVPEKGQIATLDDIFRVLPGEKAVA